MIRIASYTHLPCVVTLSSVLQIRAEFVIWLVQELFLYFSLQILKNFIDFREMGREKGRETLSCHSTYLCINLFLVQGLSGKVQPLLIWQEWFVWHWCKLAAQETGLECGCVNNDDFTILVSGSRTGHWVSMCTVWLVHSKMTEPVEQEICIKFCIKLQYSSMETIQMIQKALGVGNWRSAASS